VFRRAEMTHKTRQMEEEILRFFKYWMVEMQKIPDAIARNTYTSSRLLTLLVCGLNTYIHTSSQSVLLEACRLLL
jgi:hypothetical protein